jgi:hypothetical protein
MTIIGLDPGDERTAVVAMRGGRPYCSWLEPNANILTLMLSPPSRTTCS